MPFDTILRILPCGSLPIEFSTIEGQPYCRKDYQVNNAHKLVSLDENR